MRSKKGYISSVPMREKKVKSGVLVNHTDYYIIHSTEIINLNKNVTSF